MKFEKHLHTLEESGKVPNLFCEQKNLQFIAFSKFLAKNASFLDRNMNEASRLRFLKDKTDV